MTSYFQIFIYSTFIFTSFDIMLHKVWFWKSTVK
jgi:hypothetical protein